MLEVLMKMYFSFSLLLDYILISGIHKYFYLVLVFLNNDTR